MINQAINDYLHQFEITLRQFVGQADVPAMRIKEAMLYSLFPGGKRLRPVLVYSCGEILGVLRPSLDIIAASIELTHCYSLIHDDLPAMDNDDLRRGKPSCHKAFDEATAILTGDGLQALAIDLLLQHLPKTVSAEKTIQITKELVAASGPAGMVSGQSLDLSELSAAFVDEAKLQKIHSLKTGKLILAAVKMVVAAGEPSLEIRQAVCNYAECLGLAFQMQDDYLDQYSELGKGRASDNANRKTTFASLYSRVELAQLINEHFEKAMNYLNPLENKAKNLLELTKYLQDRSN